MGELDDKLGSLLNNPQMMQQIMTMAQQLGAQDGPGSGTAPGPAPGGMPTPADLEMIRRISSISRGSGLDPQQTHLLQALNPYLNNTRLHRLEQAMRAARLAETAFTALNQNTGR